MLNKTIETKFKAAFQSSTSIWEKNAHCWKSRKPNKKEETFKFHKEKKTKSADS